MEKTKSRRNFSQTKDVIIPSALDGGYGWVIVASSFICNMIVDGIANSFGVFVQHYSDYFGENKGTVSMSGSVLLGMHLLVGPLVGALCKKYSCREVAVVGSIIMAIAFILSIFSTSSFMFTIIYGVIGGTGFGMIYISTIILVSYYFEFKRSLAVGISICGSGFGTFFFPPMCTYLIREYAWQGGHLILSGIILNCVIFSLLLLPPECIKPKSVNKGTNVHVEDETKDVATKYLADLVGGKQEARGAITINEIVENEECTELGVQFDLCNKENIDNENKLMCSENNLSKINYCPSEQLNSKEHLHELNTMKHDSNSSNLLNMQRKVFKMSVMLSHVALERYYSYSKGPILSKEILCKLRSLREINNIEENDIEMDFYEIRKTKSENTYLFHKILSHVDDIARESISETNDYCMHGDNFQLQPIKAHSRDQNSSTDFSQTANIQCTNDLPSQSQLKNFSLSPTEHTEFIDGLFNKNNLSTSFSMQDDVETVDEHNENKIPNVENTLKVSNNNIKQSDLLLQKETSIQRPQNNTSWWNSSVSIRKDMFYSTSISNLQAFQKEINVDTYRKNNIVQNRSLLQDMWDTELLTNPIFILYVLSNVFLLAGFYIPYVFIVNTATRLETEDISEERASFLLSIMGVANMVGRIFFGFLDNLQLLNSMSLNNASLLVTVVSVLYFPYCTSYWQFVFTSTAFGFSQACVVCLTTTLLVQWFTLDKLNNSFGMLQLFRGVAIIIGIPIAGFIYEFTKSHFWTYFICGLFYFASIFLGYVMQFIFRQKKSYDKVLTNIKDFNYNEKETDL